MYKISKHSELFVVTGWVGGSRPLGGTVHANVDLCLQLEKLRPLMRFRSEIFSSPKHHQKIFLGHHRCRRQLHSGLPLCPRQERFLEVLHRVCGE